MKHAAAVVVIKRDGSSEPFSLAKLRRCILLGLAGTTHDIRIADALARAVYVHLKQLTGERRPTTDYVFGCVRTVLSRTKLGEVANRLTLHRKMRNSARKRLRVSEALVSASRTTKWRKKLLIALLQNAYGLQRSTARILAGEIETRVLSMNYAVISQVLISELIRNELMAWGLHEDVPLARPQHLAEPSASPQPHEKE